MRLYGAQGVKIPVSLLDSGHYVRTHLTFRKSDPICDFRLLFPSATNLWRPSNVLRRGRCLASLPPSPVLSSDRRWLHAIPRITHSTPQTLPSRKAGSLLVKHYDAGPVSNQHLPNMFVRLLQYMLPP